jgi:hypothetical protein
MSTLLAEVGAPVEAAFFTSRDMGTLNAFFESNFDFTRWSVVSTEPQGAVLSALQQAPGDAPAIVLLTFLK